MPQLSSLAVHCVSLAPQAWLRLWLSGPFLGSFLLAREEGLIYPWSFGLLPRPVRTHLPCVLQVELGQRPTVERSPPVTEEEWNRHVGPEGRLQHVPELKNRIFSGVSVSGYRLGWVGRRLGGSPLTCCSITPPGSQPWPSAGGLEVPSWVP